MSTHFMQSGPAVSTGQESPHRDWVVSGSTRNFHNNFASEMSNTRLLFNDAIPASASNRATHVRLPAPIVIERLLPLSEKRENVESVRSSTSSISFTTLSEERLNAAVQLAKRDLRRRRLGSLTKSPSKPSQEVTVFETSDVELLQELEVSTDEMKIKTSSPKEKAGRPRPKLSSQKHALSPLPRAGLSPPTKDSGPRLLEGSKDAPLSLEIHKLQNELEVYIKKVEELANRATAENIEEPLEPEEQIKLEARRQKQAARSARTIYTLQQQVKEIQEEMEKLRSQKMWDMKKSLALNRLAAAHRGALRALHVVIHQLSDLSHGAVPPHYKELGQLIRQLCLCSAKVEVEQGSAVPEAVVHILQKLETLDSALTKQAQLQKSQARACPPRRRSPFRSVSPTSAPKGPGVSSFPGHRKTTNPPRAGRRAASQKPKTTSQRPLSRGEVLRAGLESLVQQRALKQPQRRLQTKSTRRKGGAVHSERSKDGGLSKRNQVRAGFQQPTVCSQLQVNQLPQKERSVPWIPTSPHSPPPQRSPQRNRAEPRCLFSPVKPSSSPPKPKAAGNLTAEQAASSSEKTKDAQNEALRKAWLDKTTMQRLKELNQLSKEETERIQKLRSDVVSPSQWAERAEQKARERIQPLLDKAEEIAESSNRISPSLRNRLSEQAAERAAESAEQLSAALLEDLLEDSARVAWAAEADRQLEGMAEWRLQAPTLESMLLRMEEIQRDQEEVRRRFASITYSDPLYWDRPGAEGPQCQALGSEPASPQPIRLTRPTLRQNCAADIVLEKPVETGVLSETSLTEVASQDEQQPRTSVAFPGPVERSVGPVISVSGSVLRNIRQYREDYESYLQAVAPEAMGSFDPWVVADRLADELLSETLAEVAAEFQDAVEEYTEAVFTSEFLQPIQSPPASAAAVVSQ